MLMLYQDGMDAKRKRLRCELRGLNSSLKRKRAASPGTNGAKLTRPTVPVVN